MLQAGRHLLSNHIEGDLHTVALTLVVVQSPTSALPSVTVATRADAGTDSTYKASLTKQEVLFILWQQNHHQETTGGHHGGYIYLQ